MNALDVVLLALIALSVVLGLWRGLVRESFAVLAWVAGFPLASHFAPDVRLWLDLSDTSPALAFMLAWLLVFVAVWLVCHVLSQLLSGVLSVVGLGLVNRLLGGVFGFTRAVLSLLLLTLLVGFTPAVGHPLWQSAWVVQRAHQGVLWLKPFLPAPLEGWVV
jgi:membrane protein required for colicin V production